MDLNDVANRLLYDPNKFQLYMDYNLKRDYSPFLSFESFLLCENNLEDYLNNPELVYQKYLLYHEESEVQDYECFELFCKSFYLFPYDYSKINDYRKCENCIYFGHIKNLITNEEYETCTQEDFLYDGTNCPYHEFDVDKIKPIIRSLHR